MASQAGSNASANSALPTVAAAAALVQSQSLPESTPKVQGYNFDNGVDYDLLLQSYLTTGYQATNFGKAVAEVQAMRRWTLADEPIKEDDDDELKIMENRRKVRSTIFLGYTSNLVSAGIRETIKYLVKHRMVDCLVSTAGGVEEDLIKCLAPTFLGDFAMPGAELRSRGINRIGNLLVPNDNYCKFEQWIVPIFDQMLIEQQQTGQVWSPSRMCERLGREINNEESILYWAARNNIPIFSPAITDGSIGDMLFFHTYSNPGLVVDIVQDIRRINDLAMNAAHTGCIILGGGVIKHHILNANLMRNGANHVVLINTAQEFDGSDSGARPDESVSWGKIRSLDHAVKVYADASLVFPLLVAQTFAKEPVVAGSAE
eukprot:TRINITY_DN11882_c0_g1_i1.p1 TRINITY_DN11882_c0_g1~~TRINITY_DN11882_c0_g1_i1.p1  ORF type:complete len:374 (-),score=91.71 TRINITY_DN11882_c0_g1_i1:42-1163(-)